MSRAWNGFRVHGAPVSVGALVYNVLGGELSVRFVLKVVVVAAMAATIFGYYLFDLRHEEKES